MVTIGDRPMLWHIMQNYAHFGHKDFLLALGYKAELIKQYFLNYHSLNANFTVKLDTGETSIEQTDNVDWNVTLVQTGLSSMTGGRIKRLKEYIGNERFF